MAQASHHPTTSGPRKKTTLAMPRPLLTISRPSQPPPPTRSLRNPSYLCRPTSGPRTTSHASRWIRAPTRELGKDHNGHKETPSPAARRSGHDSRITSHESKQHKAMSSPFHGSAKRPPSTHNFVNVNTCTHFRVDMVERARGW
jgi:hypothetical protein